MLYKDCIATILARSLSLAKNLFLILSTHPMLGFTVFLRTENAFWVKGEMFSSIQDRSLVDSNLACQV